jgi:hypothetical protein
MLVPTPSAADRSGDMARMHVTALFGAACLLLAGCGASTSSHPASAPQAAPPAYVATGDAICAKQLTALNKLTQPSTPEGALSYLPKALTIMQRETGQLAVLDPSASRRAAFAAALASAHQLETVLRRFLRQMQAGVVEISTFSKVQSQSEALRADINAHFRQAGLTRCAQ